MRQLAALFAIVIVLLPLICGKREIRPQVYDCFLFFNEFELLKIRLQEMAPHVDKFVLVECEETFRGDPKPLYFQENRHLFAAYADKIIPVVVTGHRQAKKAWSREHYQRNQIARALTRCRHSDIILISDVDEIIRRSEIPKIVDLLSKNQARKIVCYQKMYTFFLNHHQGPWAWPGPVALTLHELKQYRLLPDRVRERRTKDGFTILENTGWHFSYMGGVEQMWKKLAAFSHSEVDTPEGRQHLLDRFRASSPAEPIDASFPAYVVENEARLREVGLVE